MYTPLHPTFILVKLGFTGVYFFLIFALKHRLLVRVRTLRRFLRVPTINVLSKNKKNIKNFHLKMNICTAVKYCCILNGRVCVMTILHLKIVIFTAILISQYLAESLNRNGLRTSLPWPSCLLGTKQKQTNKQTKA